MWTAMMFLGKIDNRNEPDSDLFLVSEPSIKFTWVFLV